MPGQDAFLPGFGDPVFGSQNVFRAVLSAISRPETIVDLQLTLEAPQALFLTTAAICRTLLDSDTPVWLDAPLAPV